MTNILTLPLLLVTFETATNEDWRDSVQFAVAGTATGYPAIANIGNGIITGLSVSNGTFIGDYIVTIQGANTFNVRDPDGYVIGAGVIGQAINCSGLSFTVTSGSVAFIYGDTLTITVLPKALDLTGIKFSMQMRRAVSTALVILSGDQDTGNILNGGTTGIISFAFAESTLADIEPSPAGNPYVLDVIGTADGVTRRCITGTVNVVRGVTYLST